MNAEIKYAAADMAVRNINGDDPYAVVAAWCASIGKQKEGAELSDKALRSLINKTRHAADGIAKQVNRIARLIDSALQS